MRVAANAHLNGPISKLAVLVSGNPILALDAVRPSTPTVVSVSHSCDASASTPASLPAKNFCRSPRKVTGVTPDWATTAYDRKRDPEMGSGQEQIRRW
jgi:hypothetical protein